MDRDQLEQEALRQLNRGSLDGALKAYQSILRIDHKDRRIRQKVGELLLRMGRPQEAERYLREVAEALVKEGQSRAALALYKQLVALRPEDADLQFELGECTLAAGYPNDARAHFDTAMRLYLGLAKPLDAARAGRRVMELVPGEPVHRLKVAELLETGGDAAGALTLYASLVEEYRRRGRPDEVGRIAEMALRLKPDDLGLLLDAAAARVEAGDHKRALTHLQPAFQQGPREARTLDLLARAFEGLGQGEKALKVLGELARGAEERGETAVESDALRRAVKLAPEDAALATRLAAAEERERRLERRLGSLAVAQPQHEEELVAVVKAEVYARYGFGDRALAALDGALASRPDSLPLLAALAEVHVYAGRTDAAIALAERILLRAGADADAVRDRVGILARGRGRADGPASAAPSAPVAAAVPVAVAPPAPAPVIASVIADPAPAVVASIPSMAAAAESPEARGDRLAAVGDLPGAILAYREALAADPMNDSILARIAALRRTAATPGAVPVAAAPVVVAPVAIAPVAVAPVPPRPAFTTETPEDRGDRLAAFGDLPGAIVAYREALAADPLNDGVLAKIAALRRPSAPAVQAPPIAVAPAPSYGGFALDSLDTTTFAEIDPVALDEVQALEGFDADEVRALLAVGMFADAMGMLDGAVSLEAAVLRAQAMRGLGDVTGALNHLREERDESDEADPAYAEALFELSALNTAAGKHRSALRLLEELQDLFPDYRSAEVDVRMRGLARLVK
jgi:tetratricopeptide (TPR) repeat protein